MRQLFVIACLAVGLAVGCGDAEPADEAPTTALASTLPAAGPSTTTQAQEDGSSSIPAEPPGSTTRVSTSTTSTLPPIDQVAAGLFCRDLFALGYSYEDAVVYWNEEGTPDRMDADRNGIPCQTVYPPGDVLAYWGEPLPTLVRNQFALVVAVDPGPPVVIIADYADWLWCEAAEQACREDAQGPDCPYEGLYYIRNRNPHQRTLRVDDDAEVFLAHTAGVSGAGITCEPVSEQDMEDAGFEPHPTEGCAVSASDLPAVWVHLDPSDGGSWRLVWLIVEADIVTAIQEQYTP